MKCHNTTSVFKEGGKGFFRAFVFLVNRVMGIFSVVKRDRAGEGDFHGFS